MADITKKIDISGMHCGSCASGIQMYVSSLDGVGNIEVSYNDKEAHVVYDDEKIKIEDILAGVEELGYSAKENSPA